MSISVTCRCGKKYRVRDEMAGKRAKCPACGKVFTVPQPQLPDDSPLIDLAAHETAERLSAAESLPASSKPSKKSKKEANLPLIVGIVSGTVVAVICLVLVVVMWPSDVRVANPIDLGQTNTPSDAQSDTPSGTQPDTPDEALSNTPDDAPISTPDDAPASTSDGTQEPAADVPPALPYWPGDETEPVLKWDETLLANSDFVQITDDEEFLILRFLDRAAHFYLFPENPYNTLVPEDATERGQVAYGKDQKLLVVVEDGTTLLLYPGNERTFAFLNTKSWKAVDGRNLPTTFEGSVLRIGTTTVFNEETFRLARFLKPGGDPGNDSDWQVSERLSDELIAWFDELTPSEAP